MFKKFRNFFTSIASALFAAFFVAATVYAATTISTNIATDGNLSITGLSSLNGQASTTQLSVFSRLYIGGTATTSIVGDNGVSAFAGSITVPAAFSLDTASAGVLNIGTTTANALTIGRSGITTTFPGSVTVNGPTVLAGNASTTGDFAVNGKATTTASNGNIATQGTLTLANNSTAISGMVFGYCTIANSSAISASSTGSFSCISATGITTSHRVFIQATSSLQSALIIQAASSTATDMVSVQIYNTSTSTAIAPGAISLNFFGIR